MACCARRPRDRDAERPTPQECAIAGPAVYPMSAPATAPTGPRTTAPDTAPKAALPARSWALAWNEKNDPTISAATICFFIAIPPSASQAIPKLRRHKGVGLTLEGDNPIEEGLRAPRLPVSPFQRRISSTLRKWQIQPDAPKQGTFPSQEGTTTGSARGAFFDIRRRSNEDASGNPDKNKRPVRKARDGFSGAGSILAMMKICR